MACWSGRPRCRFSSTLVLVAPVARLVGQSVAVLGGSATRSLSRVQAICQGQSWGEMKDQPSCSGRDPTGNLDQLAAHGRRRRCARSEPCAAKAAVARVRLKAITASTSQAAFAVNTPEGRCASGEPLQIGVDLFDDRVTMVGLVRSDPVEHRRIGGGEERVEPPHVEQAVLPGRPVLLGWKSGMRRTISRSGTWSGLEWAAKAVNAISATSAREIHCLEVASNTASVYSMGIHTSSAMLAIAALTRLSIRVVTDTCAPPARAGLDGVAVER